MGDRLTPPTQLIYIKTRDAATEVAVAADVFLEGFEEGAVHIRFAVPARVHQQVVRVVCWQLAAAIEFKLQRPVPSWVSRAL